MSMNGQMETKLGKVTIDPEVIALYARLVWFLLILFIVDIIYIRVYAAGIVWLVYFISNQYSDR